MKEDWVDGDRLKCIGCNRFVGSINKDELCSECEEKELIDIGLQEEQELKDEVRELHDVHMDFMDCAD